MDDRSFKPVTTTFEETWPRYSGAGLVALVLRAAEAWMRGRPAGYVARGQRVSMSHS